MFYGNRYSYPNLMTYKKLYGIKFFFHILKIYAQLYIKNIHQILIIYIQLHVMYGPVGWGCRIHRQHLCRGVKLPNMWFFIQLSEFSLYFSISTVKKDHFNFRWNSFIFKFKRLKAQVSHLPHPQFLSKLCASIWMISQITTSK